MSAAEELRAETEGEREKRIREPGEQQRRMRERDHIHHTRPRTERMSMFVMDLLWSTHSHAGLERVLASCDVVYSTSKRKKN